MRTFMHHSIMVKRTESFEDLGTVILEIILA